MRKCPPFLQLPLSLGAHIAVYSTTKYINGHSDAVGGAVIVNDRDIFKKIRFYQNAAGAVQGPFECWLTLRGLKTLAVRKIFSFAESLGGVESLACYPSAMTHSCIPMEDKQRWGIIDGIIRLSIGIEDVEDIIEDLSQALWTAFTCGYHLRRITLNLKMLSALFTENHLQFPNSEFQGSPVAFHVDVD